MLANRELVATLNWFPWISDECTDADRRVASKLEVATTNSIVITRSDATIIARWYSHVPEAFRTKYSDRIFDILSARTTITT